MVDNTNTKVAFKSVLLVQHGDSRARSSHHNLNSILLFEYEYFNLLNGRNENYGISTQKVHQLEIEFCPAEV